MKIFIYVLEFVITFIAIFFLFHFLNKLFLKKINEITSIVFAFLVLGFFFFLISPFIYTFSYPVFVYFPALIIVLIYNLYKISKTT
jgi:hypothetical protein